jgi:hypothetical protein
LSNPLRRNSCHDGRGDGGTQRDTALACYPLAIPLHPFSASLKRDFVAQRQRRRKGFFWEINVLAYRSLSPIRCCELFAAKIPKDLKPSAQAIFLGDRATSGDEVLDDVLWIVLT